MFRFCCVMFGASSFPRAVFHDLFFALRGLCSDCASHALRPTRATCLSSPHATRGGRSPLQIKLRTKPIVAHWKSGAKPSLFIFHVARFVFGFREPRFTSPQGERSSQSARNSGGRGFLQSKSRTKPIVARWKSRAKPSLFIFHVARFVFGFREPRFTRAQLGGGRGPLQSKSRTKPIVAHWKSGAKPPLVSSLPLIRG